MPEDQTTNFLDRFNNEGGPVPEANPNHLKLMWNRGREAARMADLSTRTFGLGAIGLDASDLGDEPKDKLGALTIRLALLQSLFERNVLRDYVHGDEFTDEVFQAAASIPCDKEDVGEAIVPFAMKLCPDMDHSELKREMIEHGYDPERPKIDSKFIAWMRNR